jgi:starch synthase
VCRGFAADEQKGLDLLLDACRPFWIGAGSSPLLGTGDPRWNGPTARRPGPHPGVAVHIGYDEAMAHRMIAGGDAILVPSRFEPCGLTQLYGCATAPSRSSLTGGLADTVIHASPGAGGTRHDRLAGSTRSAPKPRPATDGPL